LYTLLLDASGGSSLLSESLPGLCNVSLRLQALTVVNVDVTVFWDVTPYSLLRTNFYTLKMEAAFSTEMVHLNDNSSILKMKAAGSPKCL
jgi:hypothetical protein